MIMHFLFYSVILLLFPAYSAAWPWPRFLPEIDSLVVRANSDAAAASESTASHTGSAAKTTAAAASSTAAGTITSAPDSTKSKSKESSTEKSEKHSSKEKSSESKKKTPVTTHTTYDARLPAGGVSMITPNALSGAEYYKIGDYVTFAWNYTSLSATPTAINVMASCSLNSELYPIAMNQSVGDTTGAATWDTGKYQSTAASPLPMATYTLVIYDAASAVTAVAGAGYLGVFDSYSFGMYTPQAYTPLADGFQCVTCSGALSNMERQALGFMFTMGAITVLSFTWFVGGINIIW